MQHFAESAVDWGKAKLSQLEDWVAHDVLMGGWSPRDMPSQEGKVALVTGGNSGIGFEAARKLAENGAHVYLVSRDVNNGYKAADAIRDAVGEDVKIEVLGCDMSSLRNVVALAREFRQRTNKLDVLVNDAGVFFPGPFKLTRDKLEDVLHINYYAHVLLTLLLLDTLRNTPGSRVVFVTSVGEQLGKLQWSNLTGEHYHDSGLIPYCTSKLYILMAMKELAVRVPDVDFICVHPGLVATPLQYKADYRYLWANAIVTWAKIVGLTPYLGAYSLMYGASEPSLTGCHFAYYGPNYINLWPITARNAGNKAANNPVSCWRLFEETIHILKDRLKGGEASLMRVPPRPNPATAPAGGPQGRTLPIAMNGKKSQ